jgi:hypothetical protein
MRAARGCREGERKHRGEREQRAWPGGRPTGGPGSRHVGPCYERVDGAAVRTSSIDRWCRRATARARLELELRGRRAERLRDAPGEECDGGHDRHRDNSEHHCVLRHRLTRLARTKVRYEALEVRVCLDHRTQRVGRSAPCAYPPNGCLPARGCAPGSRSVARLSVTVGHWVRPASGLLVCERVFATCHRSMTRPWIRSAG